MEIFPIVLIPKDFETILNQTPSIDDLKHPGNPPNKVQVIALIVQTVVLVIASSFIPGLLGKLTLFAGLLAIGYSAYSKYSDYKFRLLDYRESLINFEEEKRYRSSPLGKQTFQKNLLLQALQETETYDQISENAIKGYSEKAFGEYLTRYFANNIKQNSAFTIPNFDYPYSPDFAYIDKESNLHIDIEIDEPYAYLNKTPTHYLNAENDLRRNQFFLDRYWIVVRFSEEQVVKHPESCCKIIALVICKFTNNDWILDDFVEIPDLERMKVWSYEEAKNMAKNQYRDQYLKRSDRKIIPKPIRLTKRNFIHPRKRKAS